MVSPAPPVFGKRQAPRATVRAPAVVPISPDHAAFFAVARREVGEADTRPPVVPRSFRAAILAGLVVGCCLAGLEATEAGDTLRHVSNNLLTGAAAARLLPVAILLGLLGGAQAASTSLLLAHGLLRRLGWSGHAAYALAGGAMAGVLCGLDLALGQTGLVDTAMLPTHGLAVDVVAGAGAGFFYRIFAGARRG